MRTRVIQKVEGHDAQHRRTFFARAGPEPFVVLDVPPLGVVPRGLLPLLVLGQRDECLRPRTLGALDDGGDELLEKPQAVQQRRPEVVDEVDHEALDVAPAEVLVGHDYEVAVPQRL